MAQSTPHTAATRYHRDWNNSTQTSAVAKLQQTSGEMWGDVPKNGGAFRCVQVYRHALGPADMGIEFTTTTTPTAGAGTPWETRWLYCDHGVPKCSPGVWLNARGFAVLRVTVTKVVP